MGNFFFQKNIYHFLVQTPIKTGYKIEESQLTLDMYTDFPESFLVADNFCKW